MKKNIRELEELIEHHKELYYLGRAEITDLEFDELEEELRLLSPESAILKTVGIKQRSDNKVKHEQKMLSLAKTYKIDELESWMDSREIISMYKIDGMSCSLIYEEGELVMAKTRGDGSFGENITAKALEIKSIPKMISEKANIEVRGEIYCEERSFFELSDEMVSLGLEKPTSQRNIVAGLISRKDYLQLSGKLTFKAFELLGKESIETEVEKVKFLQKEGFDTLEYTLHKNKKSIEKTIEEAKEFMAEGEFLIDGIVFSFNDQRWHRELGETAHHPRYKMAFKFQGEAKDTNIREIIWGVSRNGILTPVANVEPVELSGANISRVTLHNFGLVKQFNLKSGDRIKIVRSGEVIPKFLELVDDSGNEFSFPENCPSCGEEVRIIDIRLVCVNKKCPAIIKESILNYIQKIGIDDLSSKRLDELIKARLVLKISDLYKIKMDDLLTLDKVKEKLATKLIAAIEKSKSVDLITFLSALGISGGAYNKCEKVVFAGYDSLEKIKELSPEKLRVIDGFAEKSSVDFFESLSAKFELINELEQVGFSFEEVVKNETALTDKKICITGSLSEKRSVIEGKIRDASGIVVSSVTKNTDILVTNDQTSGSSKLKKAQSLGIEILTEEELIKLTSS
ncbi:NAD-dependent DNA ligase LigA [Halobacteriovorax sp. JY17]|uniref:NAD-dependent DNA ligase LigA n=1 Tax=Halobacteriovorax sp. JY17 TaxID=2014617 RepID=UPI000C404BC8|nr:NAD-dependent DNA ligase LigA [Halobacteriovorax sp. JY17]PIK14300.1 MAG: DNA ligase (NAD(+)) LigA [Halobacteriovorax sp. JY17]